MVTMHVYGLLNKLGKVHGWFVKRCTNSTNYLKTNYQKDNLITKIKVKLDINSSTGLSRNVSEDLISLQSCLDKHSTLFKLEIIQSAFRFVLSSRY